MIELDGSFGEGGGQIIRTAAAFSALTGKPFHITGIRKGRGKPGLQMQHMAALEAAGFLCDAKIEGLSLGSSEIRFIPGELHYRNLNIDVKTAGSVTLLLQALLPVAIFSDKKLKITLHGGTDTSHAMPYDYLANVFLPHLARYAAISVMLEKRGYYPKGGGKVIMKIRPKYFAKNFSSSDEFVQFLRKQDKKIDLLEQGTLLAIFGRSHASKDLMKASVAERQAKAAKFMLGSLDVSRKIDIEYNETLSTGSGITLYAVFSKYHEMNKENPVILGADCLGARGKAAEKVGEEAAKELVAEIRKGAPVDQHLSDQLLPYLALFGGSMRTSLVTDHCLSGIYVIEKFLDTKIKIEKNIISS
jgi:RNA 3'-phosphate cyclase